MAVLANKTPHPASASLGHPLPDGERKAKTAEPSCSSPRRGEGARRAGEGFCPDRSDLP
jgi:hypothetical protein